MLCCLICLVLCFWIITLDYASMRMCFVVVIGLLDQALCLLFVWFWGLVDCLPVGLWWWLVLWWVAHWVFIVGTSMFSFTIALTCLWSRL